MYFFRRYSPPASRAARRRVGCSGAALPAPAAALAPSLYTARAATGAHAVTARTPATA